jgi:RNA polymerase sigma-70 factor (ECF subfamily)
MTTVEIITQSILSSRLPLLAYIYSVTRDYHLAEDVYQELFVKAVGRADSFDSTDHMLKWFRVSARNRSIDLIRRTKGSYVGLSEETLEALEDEWLKHTKDLEAERSEALEKCLQSLTPRSRTIVKMQYFENRSSKEIAEFIGGKVESAYQAITRIHKALKDCIDRHMRPNHQ